MKTRGSRHPWGVMMCASASLLAACQTPPRVAQRAPTVQRQTDKSQRESVAVTIYNQNFGLVKDTRRLKLAAGRVELSFQDVSANIQPESVQLPAAA